LDIHQNMTYCTFKRHLKTFLFNATYGSEELATYITL